MNRRRQSTTSLHQTPSKPNRTKTEPFFAPDLSKLQTYQQQYSYNPSEPILFEPPRIPHSPDLDSDPQPLQSHSAVSSYSGFPSAPSQNPAPDPTKLFSVQHQQGQNFSPPRSVYLYLAYFAPNICAQKDSELAAKGTNLRGLSKHNVFS